MKVLKVITMVVIIICLSLVSIVLFKEYLYKPPTSSNSSSSSITQSDIIVEPEKVNCEVKAVWIPFMDFNYIGKSINSKIFADDFTTIITNCKNQGINTVFVQVRPYSDALYPSQYYPWSHLLTGKQGQSVNFDPLSIMVKIAHDNGIKLQCWINPLRIKNTNSNFDLSSDNPYMIWKNDNDPINDDYVGETEKGSFYNPAYPQVRKLIVNGIEEIVRNYDIDGIHFDDYFYPTQSEEFDKKAYESYKNSSSENKMSLSQWRVENINSLIRECYSAIKAIKSEVQFGISPQGNMSNCDNMYADYKTWCSQKGYIDYICPQIYYSFENETQPFAQTATNWKNLQRDESVKLYCGIALYKAGSDVDEGQWQKSNDIIQKQLESIYNLGYDGFALYSYDFLLDKQTEAEMTNAKAFYINN